MTQPSYRPRRPADLCSGFTLLEILIVLTILAILTTLAGSNLMRQINAQRLQDSAAQFTSEITTARGSVFQYNRDATITVAANGQSYTVTKNGASTTYTLQAGTTITPGDTTISYAAPYSVLTSTPTTFTVAREGVDKVIVVRTVGVLGDVSSNAQ